MYYGMVQKAQEWEFEVASSGALSKTIILDKL